MQWEANRNDVRFGSRLCENAKAINRDRTSCSFKTVLDAHMASDVNFGIETQEYPSRRASGF
jgi:hypothetical protein